MVVPLAQLHPGQPALQAGTARWIVVLPSARSRRPFQAMTAGPSNGHVIVPNGKSAVEVESSPCPAPRPAPAPASSPPPRARRTAAPTPASCAACPCAARPPFAAPTAPAAPSTAPARLGRGSREHARAHSARSRRSCASRGAWWRPRGGSWVWRGRARRRRQARRPQTVWRAQIAAVLLAHGQFRQRGYFGQRMCVGRAAASRGE